jgi:hypothetical protein
MSKNDNLFIQLSRLQAIRKCVSVYMHISECITCVKQLTRKKHEAIKAMRALLLFLILSWGGCMGQELGHGGTAAPCLPLLPPMRTTLVSPLRSITSVTGTTWLVLLRCRQIYRPASMLIILLVFLLCRWFWWTVRPLPWWKRRSAILVFWNSDLISYVSQWTS